MRHYTNYTDAFAGPFIEITCIFPAGIQTVSVSRDYVDKHHETTTSEHKTLNQSCFNVVPTSVTVSVNSDKYKSW